MAASNKKLSKEVGDALNGVVPGGLKQVQASAPDIQKRGYTYPGDGDNGAFGLGNGQHGEFINRYNAFHGAGQGGGNFGLGGPSFIPFNAGLGGYSPFAGAGASLDNRNNIYHMKMAMATEAYKGFGVIKNVIDLMCNFASEGITINHPRKSVRKFYQRWAQLVDLEGRVKDILREYYKYGNVFIYTTMGTMNDTDYTRMKNIVADNNDPADTERNKEALKQRTKKPGDREIPWRYTLLNPFQIFAAGSEFYGETRWVFVMDEATYQKYKDAKVRDPELYDFLDDTEMNLPQEFKDKITSEGGKNRVVRLDSKKLWPLHYMKDDHEDWADPMIWPVIGDVMYKNKLRAMDISVCDSAIAAVTIYKLGNMDKGFIAPAEHLSAFAQMLRTPTYAMNVVWNDAVSVDSTYPPVDKILGIAKYESVDKDIMKGLGIPEILLGGDGGNYSSAFLGVRTLLERLEEGRREVQKWIDSQLRLIATAMGHRDVPTVKFGQMSLRDENAEKQLIMGLADRGLISVEAVHEVFGFETEVEAERLRGEKKMAEEEGIFQKHGPYTDPMSDMSKEEEMKMASKQKLAEQKAKPVSPNGRPGGSKGIPQKKKRVTKPTGMASWIDVQSAAAAKYEEIEKLLSTKVIALRGVKNWKSLPQEDKDCLDGLVAAVLSGVQLDDVVTEELVDKLLGRELTPIIPLEDTKDLSMENRRQKRIAAWVWNVGTEESNENL